MATYASESGHWYLPDGTPAYTVEGKNGKTRPTTLRDARVLGLLPSVTSIIKVAAAPGLERWKLQNAVLAALTHPELTGTDADVDLILQDAAEQSYRAMEKGTQIHGWIERGFLGKDVPEEAQDYIVQVAKCLEQACGRQTWSVEKSFASDCYGGKVDLHSPEGGWVVDFKTTDKPLADLKTWDSHWMQLAAYREGLVLPEARCGILYINTRGEGARFVEVPEEDLERGWTMFDALCTYWQAIKGYQP